MSEPVAFVVCTDAELEHMLQQQFNKGDELETDERNSRKESGRQNQDMAR